MDIHEQHRPTRTLVQPRTPAMRMQSCGDEGPDHPLSQRSDQFLGLSVVHDAPLEFFLADPYIDDCLFQCVNNCSNPAHVGVVQSDVHRKEAWL